VIGRAIDAFFDELPDTLAWALKIAVFLAAVIWPVFVGYVGHGAWLVVVWICGIAFAVRAMTPNRERLQTERFERRPPPAA
jgi:hypothetical protein